MGNQESQPVAAPVPSPSSTTKVEVPHSSPPNFVTGVDVEEQSFTWTIGNFNTIRKQQGLIDFDSQRIDLTVGHPTGSPTNCKWIVSLREQQRHGLEGRRWIGVCVGHYDRIPTTYRTQFLFTIKNRKGEVIREAETGLMYINRNDPYNAARTSMGFAEDFIDADQDDDLCPWGALMINITVRMYSPSQPQSLGSTEAVEVIQEKFQKMFLEQFQKDFADVLKSPDASADIKIVAKDGREFTVKRGILAVRSDVFAAMLSCDMLEANSGVINLPDISSDALETLLNFLGTGKLLPEWSESDVILELTNAAAKYQLEDLLEFLNLTIGKVGKADNAIPLLTLARQLSLKVAEEELIQFVRKRLMGSDESFMQILNMLIDESDEPEKKRQKLN